MISRLFRFAVTLFCIAQATTGNLRAAPDTHRDETNNPLYPEFQRVAAPYGVDITFTRNVTRLDGWDAGLYEDALSFPIFCREPQSLDVLLVGDSTMSWGVIPSVVSQVSGLNVGMFAFRSMYLNTRSLRIVRRIRDAYLKPGGLSVFGYDLWTQGMDPNSFRRTELLQLEALSDPAFVAFREKRRQECHLKKSSLMSPAATAARNPIALHTTQFIKWDAETFTLIGPFSPRSIHSDFPAYEHFPVSYNQQINAKSLLEFPGRKAFLISFYTTHDLYRRQRAFYETLYSRHIELIDLGRLHPVNAHYPMDDANHPANTAGLEKSILIGLWLKEYAGPPAGDR